MTAAGAGSGGGEQQELAGMPARLYPCTPTRLGTWLDCPRRYRFAYLDRPQPPKGPPWAHNSIGAAVHSALADWWSLPVPDRTPDSGRRLVRRRWLTDGFRDAEQSARASRRALEWVAGYVAGLDPAEEPVGVERTVSTPTRTLVLSGRVDRIDAKPRPGRQFAAAADPANADPANADPGNADPGNADLGNADLGNAEPEDDELRDELADDELPDDGLADDEPGGLVIVDYKTGRYVPDADDARTSLALAAYAVAAARTLRRPCSRVELHHLPSRTRAVARHTPDGLRRAVSRAESIAFDCSRADAAYRSGDRGDATFPPVPSPGCSWCDFRRHCPEGQAAAPDRAPWSALPD